MQILNNQPEKIIKFTWLIESDGYVYTNTWEIPEQEWNELTEQEILSRQETEYNAWRLKMRSPGA